MISYVILAILIIIFFYLRVLEKARYLKRWSVNQFFQEERALLLEGH